MRTDLLTCQCSSYKYSVPTVTKPCMWGFHCWSFKRNEAYFGDWPLYSLLILLLLDLLHTFHADNTMQVKPDLDLQIGTMFLVLLT